MPTLRAVKLGVVALLLVHATAASAAISPNFDFAYSGSSWSGLRSDAPCYDPAPRQPGVYQGLQATCEDTYLQIYSVFMQCTAAGAPPRPPVSGSMIEPASWCASWSVGGWSPYGSGSVVWGYIPGSSGWSVIASMRAVCPSNSYLAYAGGQPGPLGMCVCGTGFRESGKVCVPAQCTSSASCDDRDFCNGIERCDAGVCVGAAAPPTCNDNKTCTTDVCSPSANSCVHTLDPSVCVCNAFPLPEVSSSVMLPIPPIEMPCSANSPYKIGVAVEASAMFKGKDPSCDNGCVGEFSGELSFTSTVKLCSSGKPKGAKGKYSQKRKGCPDCDRVSCRQTCKEGGCRESDASGTVGVGLEVYRAVEKPTKLMNFKCTAKGNASGDVTVTYKGSSSIPTADGGSCGGACVSCDQVSTDFTASIGLGGDCTIGAPKPPATLSGAAQKGNLSVVGKGSFSVKESATMKVTGQGGQCTNQTCASGDFKGEARFKLSGTVSKLWWKATVECGGGVEGCAGLNSCGSCSCGSGSGQCAETKADTLSCKVLVTANPP